MYRFKTNVIAVNVLVVLCNLQLFVDTSNKCIASDYYVLSKTQTKPLLQVEVNCK